MRALVIVFSASVAGLAPLSAAPARPIGLEQAAVPVPQVVDLAKLKPQHPRLFADDTRIAAIKRQTDIVSNDLRKTIMAEAESALTKPDIDYPPAGSNTEYPGPGGKFSAVREAERRMFHLGLAFRLTGDRRYFEKARRDLLQLIAVPDWNPKHYLTLGQGALAAAVGYDWFYAELTPAERDAVAEAIKTKALVQSLEARPGTTNGEDVNRSWLDGVYNWNPVVNGSLATAALAIADREPELARTILNRSIHYIQYAAAGYEPDGAWPEAPNYWAFGTSYYVIAIEALRSALGSDYGVAAHPGFLKTGSFNVQVVGPTGNFYNFSDNSEEYQNEPQMLWLARETGRADLISTELADIARLAGRNPVQRLAGREMRSNRHTALELLYWSPALLGKKSTVRPPLHWTARGPMPIAVMRSAWGDRNATFVAMKGGTPTDSHSHMDIGSFVLESGGVRWAIDLGSESYDMMRKVKLDLWNMKQDSGRWTTFRVGPEGHNILRFDNGPQIVGAKGTMSELPGKGVVGNAIDLSAYYAPAASQVTRSIRLLTKNTVDIRDRWTLRDAPATVTFQWLTRAAVERIPGGLRLMQEGKTLNLTLENASAYAVIVEDVSKPRLPQDSPNPGLTRILIRKQTPASGSDSLHLTARLLP